MKYVYILESLDSEHFYVGITEDLRARLAKHNAGEVPHTSKYGPWRLRTYIAFSDEKGARAFEKYLKSGSGTAFAKKHFRASARDESPLLPQHRIQPIAQRDDLVLHRHEFADRAG
jgi:putative endonuclease